MADINFTFPCQACNGTGTRWHNEFAGGPLVAETPCSRCGGDGRRTSSLGMDDALLQQVLANQASIIADLDYIHGKVTAIWNAVKPPKEQ